MMLPSMDFESIAYTIPPPARCFNYRVLNIQYKIRYTKSIPNGACNSDL